jgi:hypothetical protein
MRSRFLVVLALVVTACALGALKIGASTPSSDTVAVPAAGQSTTVSWTGTIPVGANPTSDCDGSVVAASD